MKSSNNSNISIHQMLQLFSKPLIAALPLALYFKDLNDTYAFCNPAFTQIFKSLAETVIGKQDKDLWSKQVKKISAHDIQVFEKEITLPPNTSAIFLIKEKFLLDKKNNLIGKLGVCIDITDERKNQNDEKQAVFFLENIVANMPGHVYWKDKNGLYLGSNIQVAHSAGLNSVKAIIGKSDDELAWKSKASVFKETDTRIMRTGKAETLEEPGVRANGEMGTYLTRKVPLRGPNSEIIGILGISIDITLEKEAEKLRIEWAKAQKEKVAAIELYANRMKELAATVAHEMRTPLLGIKNAAEGLGIFLPHLLEAYEKARDKALISSRIPSRILPNLHSLINDIVKQINSAFTFIDMLFTKLRETEFDKDDFIEYEIKTALLNAIEKYPLSEHEKNLIHIEIKNEFNFKGNEELFNHIIFNLLKNALYYIAAASKGEIYIWTEIATQFNELHFKDTGSGISQKILNHIFDKFFSTTYHGTGIGLAFCKKVIESFGGKITCHSIEGDYTEFILYFPKI